VAGADAKSLIVKAVTDLQQQVPALAGLKIVAELELRGRGDVQLYRVEMIGPAQPPKVTKDIASDAKVRVSIPRAEFNELVEKGQLRHWHEAFDSGIARAVGPPQIVRLIQAVVAKQEERDRLRRARTRH
jgi:hypothetical protein